MGDNIFTEDQYKKFNSLSVWLFISGIGSASWALFSFLLSVALAIGPEKPTVQIILLRISVLFSILLSVFLLRIAKKIRLIKNNEMDNLMSAIDSLRMLYKITGITLIVSIIMSIVVPFLLLGLGGLVLRAAQH